MDNTAKKINTRDIALSVLMDIDTKNTYSNVALQKALSKNQFSDKTDRAFISRLCEGVVEKMITLDYIVNEFSKTKIKKCKPLIRSVLRMGTYQIMYMDKVPDSAATDESVKLVKKHGMSSLSGFVNGILRNISRNKENIKFPSKSEGVKYYSVMYSIPEELCGKLIKDYPDDYEKIFEGTFAERKTSICVNESKTTKADLTKLFREAGINVWDGIYDDKALLIDGYDFVRKIPGYKKGYFSIQDESSMCAVRALMGKVTSTPGEELKVMDMCAAPGGKSVLAAQYMPSGHIYSMDIYEDKLDTIKENVSRLGFDDVIEVSMQDATEFLSEYETQMDAVIADVPCSGLGIIGRKNDIKYHADLEALDELITLQQSILKNAVSYVKKGGHLLFSTCTINPDENESNVSWLLENYKDLELIAERKFVQGIDSCDGFFYAVFKKN